MNGMFFLRFKMSDSHIECISDNLLPYLDEQTRRNSKNCFYSYILNFCVIQKENIFLCVFIPDMIPLDSQIDFFFNQFKIDPWSQEKIFPSEEEILKQHQSIIGSDFPYEEFTQIFDTFFSVVHWSL